MAEDGHRICVDKGYPIIVDDTLKEIKECYSEGLYDFIERMKKEEKKRMKMKKKN